jgi:hypothetical protein
LSKIENPGTKVDSAVFKIVLQIVKEIFSHLVFLITLPKKKTSPEGPGCPKWPSGPWRRLVPVLLVGCMGGRLFF